MIIIFHYDIDADKYLYHYTSASTFLEKIITSGQLRFSPLSATNDPRETKEWYFTLMGEVDGIDSLKLMREAGELTKTNVKLLCLTRDNAQKMSGMNFHGRGFCHPRMWAQYAENHRGVCLIFDKSQLATNIAEHIGEVGKIFEGQVSYSENDPVDAIAFRLESFYVSEKGLPTLINEKRLRFYRNYFFSKNSDWQDEDEYRYVLLDSSNDYRFVPIINCLKGIVLGLDFPDIYKEILRPYAAKHKIDVGKLYYLNLFYGIHPAWVN